jgi:hypothetical protein
LAKGYARAGRVDDARAALAAASGSAAPKWRDRSEAEMETAVAAARAGRFAEADGIAHAIRSPCERARALGELGAFLAASGHAPEARPVFAEALGAATTVGTIEPLGHLALIAARAGLGEETFAATNALAAHEQTEVAGRDRFDPLANLAASELRSRRTLGERPRWGDSVNFRKNPFVAPIFRR